MRTRDIERKINKKSFGYRVDGSGIYPTITLWSVKVGSIQRVDRRNRVNVFYESKGNIAKMVTQNRYAASLRKCLDEENIPYQEFPSRKKAKKNLRERFEELTERINDTLTAL